jgi:hypothetical protein
MAISWQDVITSFLTTVGGGAVCVGAAAWLIRTVITHQLARDTKLFETQLKANADAEIERLKNSLQMAALEHGVRFSKLHERRAEVIAELYKRFVVALQIAERFVLSGAHRDQPERQEEFTATVNGLFEFYQYLETNRIYLPGGTCVLLDKFVQVVREPLNAFGVYGSIKNPNQQTLKEEYDVLIKALDAFYKDDGIPAIRKDLEAEFRAILGVAEPLAVRFPNSPT